MRGTREIHGRRHGPMGIIPAHAGNTPRRCGHAPHMRDHPRACGEHSPAETPTRSNRGSSPRMRGTPVGLGRFGRVGGIIPAHAGNTLIAVSIASCSGDHPRACGEHLATPGRAARQTGSSPRMRGTHFEISTIPRFLDSFCLFFIQFYFEYFFACRYLLALLHPRRRAPPKDTSFALDGRLTSSNPSQSVGDQSAPCTLNARCCSFLAE